VVPANSGFRNNFQILLTILMPSYTSKPLPCSRTELRTCDDENAWEPLQPLICGLLPYLTTPSTPLMILRVAGFLFGQIYSGLFRCNSTAEYMVTRKLRLLRPEGNTASIVQPWSTNGFLPLRSSMPPKDEADRECRIPEGTASQSARNQSRDARFQRRPEIR
jgi:hypothetical protein